MAQNSAVKLFWNFKNKLLSGRRRHQFEFSGQVNSVIANSPHVRESMTVLDSGFHTVDSGFRLLDSGFQLSGFRIRKRTGFQIVFCFNAFLRISFSCSNLAKLKDVV